MNVKRKLIECELQFIKKDIESFRRTMKVIKQMTCDMDQVQDLIVMATSSIDDIITILNGGNNALDV
jgi:hypothetical protein